MNTSHTDGLATVEKYYSDYGLRAKELKNEGRKIMGYLSALGPIEVMAAAGFVPLRLKGNVNEPIQRLMPTWRQSSVLSYAVYSTRCSKIRIATLTA